MAISVTELKHRCLDIVREVERTGRAVAVTRHGTVVAHLEPAPAATTGEQRPWERLRAMGGTLHATPAESVLRAEDFEASR